MSNWLMPTDTFYSAKLMSLEFPKNSLCVILNLQMIHPIHPYLPTNPLISTQEHLLSVNLQSTLNNGIHPTPPPYCSLAKCCLECLLHRANKHELHAVLHLVRHIELYILAIRPR